ncbi:hypothetical protein B7495_07395 [Cryobacterium sp. LW097]|uniref:hypothetical protein n=1 Tax=unclassified Cryobacterium TaxID=2649013 RepID=UPI000B4CD414|nr:MULTISPECIES: hypothetical protein [unclassified Cryobacterium]ASD21939.1 hypothetical protein B7495_07395 [Cryobacterium sp. LW097]TFC59183.1 hypothetical protein E3O60_09265 [Cryobacterium sp. TMB1-7]TFC87023.1 hypothetical protein E3T19_13380 [Cryobacterium sp. TMT4-31]
MANDKTILKTSAGVEALLTLFRSETTLFPSNTAIVLEATAIPSAATGQFDAVYGRALKRYLDAAARTGIRYAGAPPLSGAQVMLAEIRVTPPRAMRTIGREIQGKGGTGTEWVARWTWDLAGIESIDGELLIQTAVDAITLPVPRR